MASLMYSLLDLKLVPGQQESATTMLAAEPYRHAGTEYPTQAKQIEIRLDITVMTRGYSFRMRFDTLFQGPCARCLENARIPIKVDAREVHDPDAGDSELNCDFVANDTLDVEAWAADAIAVEFPARVLCRDDCKGLCPNCGINRNEAKCDCDLTPTDGRWEKLKDLKLGE